MSEHVVIRDGEGEPTVGDLRQALVGQRVRLTVRKDEDGKERIEAMDFTREPVSERSVGLPSLERYEPAVGERKTIPGLGDRVRPRDDFEAHLFERAIELMVARWPNVVGEWAGRRPGEGTWWLQLFPPWAAAGQWREAATRVLVECWVERDGDRPVVRWTQLLGTGDVEMLLAPGAGTERVLPHAPWRATAPPVAVRGGG